ncbi:MAG: apolipoprotein N-acyltransferase [Rhizobiaceae bacterium]
MNRLQTNIAEPIIILEGWRARLLAIVAGALSALALAPYHFSPILLITFPILIWLLDGSVAPSGGANFLRRYWPAFRTGWAFGFGYFLASFWWVGKAFLVDADEFLYLLPLAMIALPLGLGLFWGGATALARLAWRQSGSDHGWMRLIALACSFTLFEWLRGTLLTGLPWNNVAYGLMPTPLFMQSSALIGLYGMTFVTVLVATTIGVGLAENRKLLLLPLGLVLAHSGFGLYRLSTASDASVDHVKLRIVQPAINQAKKWDAAHEAEIMGRYLELSNTNRGPKAASVGAFTHVIWPESAFPFILTQRRDQLAAIANLLPPTTTLITGAMRMQKAVNAGEQDKIFNSLYVINGSGEIIEARDKTKLVPFGEFLPFQSTLESFGIMQLTGLRGGFAHGTSRKTVSTKTAPPFLPLICYEIVYSGAIRANESSSANENSSEGGEPPQWIVNLTNDAWFGMTAGPYQHAHQAQVRAVEEGLPVVRAANNGISMVVDAYGRIRESLALGQRGVVDANLPVVGPPTLFSRYGNMPILVFVCLIFLFLVGISLRNTKRL